MSRSGSVRRLVGRALRRVGLLRPQVCVLVADGDAELLDATLHALRAVPRADLAVLVAADQRSRVAASHAAADWRVRVVGTRDWSAAARSVTRTRAPFVIALEAGEVPPRGNLGPELHRLRHGRPGLGVGTGDVLAEPAAAVFGRAAWRAAARAGSARLALVEALARVPDAVRLPGQPRRQARSAIRGVVDTRPDLPRWLDVQRRAAERLGPDSPLYSAWARSGLAGSAQRYLQDTERYDASAWADLHAAIGSLVAGTGDEELAVLPVEPRIRVVLAAAGQRDDLQRFVADRRFAAGQFATTTAQGVVRAVLPVPSGLPDELLRLSPDETTLRASVRRLRWVGDDLEMHVFACIAGVDLAACPPATTARLVGGDRVVEVAVQQGEDRDVTRWMGTHHVNHDRGVFTARIPITELARPGRLDLEVTVAAGGVVRSSRVVDHDAAGSAGLLRPRHHQGLWVAAEVDPAFALVAGRRSPGPVAHPAVAVDDLSLDDGILTVRGTGLERLVVDGLQPVRSGTEPGVAERSWSLRHDPWGFGSQPIAPGRFVLEGADGHGVALSERLAARLPELVLTGDHRAVVRREPRAEGHALVLVLEPPLSDDEVGPYCQHRLQEWYADRDEHELDPDAVYLQAYTGRNATDSPLAISEELARTRPDLNLTWAVADAGSRVPRGSTTVLWRSRQWYAALARSRYVVTNIELESWFRRRSGQEVLQTFHGYPSKAMGIGLWRQKNFTASRIEQQLDRTSRNWSLLLTPTPEMDVHYRANYRYDGPILAAGYPRDDALLSPAAAEVRTSTRARLGLDADTVAVLYAPTWRDDQATDFRSARMVDHLDVTAAAQSLGPGYVLLLRGHRFMSASSTTGSRVVDVTTYPEVNDLILAADAVVLDYSSMRFDVALTGAPMVFLVPDLEEYATTKRGFLYDFAPTAPGPHLSTSTEVVEALRDLDGVRSRHREEYRRFNDVYNRHQDGSAARRAVETFFG